MKAVRLKFYEIALIGKKLAPLTYASNHELSIGQYVGVNTRGAFYKGIVVRQVKKPDFNCKEIEEIRAFVLPRVYFEMANFIATYYVCELGEAFALFEENTPSICLQPSNIVSSVNLTEKQNEALKFLKNNKTALLFGDTGSGKTEIYMKFIDEFLAQGKNALMLLPEIALTPQTLARLKAHYGDAVALWHSKITAAKKKKTLEAINSGSIRILVGARSALFVPMSNLGVIVVDEEHDDAFKSESTPRYNARDLAIWLADKLGINIVLGSATPSLNTYNKFAHFRLRGGFIGANKRYVYENAAPSITPFIIEKLQKTIENNMQAIVFLPTRANFKYLICADCKAKVECAYCSVGMSLHKNDNALKCHYCGWSQKTPTKCSDCGGELRAYRLGTLEAAQAIKEFLPDVDILDKDAASTPKKLATILENFATQKTKILVGTQMLSKGHDYGQVSLAVALGIDSLLASSDFRAKEKALALITQLAGRAGRRGDAEVIIQTQNEEFFKEYLLNYENFLDYENRLRDGRYPPFVRFCRLIFSSSNRNTALKDSNNALEALKAAANVEVLGHGEALINKIGGKFRFEILLRSKKIKALIDAAHLAVHFNASVDMDPLSYS